MEWPEGTVKPQDTLFLCPEKSSVAQNCVAQNRLPKTEYLGITLIHCILFQPLYEQLHAYVRQRLHEKYGDVVDPEGPIPAHLLGKDTF